MSASSVGQLIDGIPKPWLTVIVLFFIALVLPRIAPYLSVLYSQPDTRVLFVGFNIVLVGAIAGLAWLNNKSGALSTEYRLIGAMMMALVLCVCWGLLGLIESYISRDIADFYKWLSSIIMFVDICAVVAIALFSTELKT
jgi:hypothetical protein